MSIIRAQASELSILLTASREREMSDILSRNRSVASISPSTLISDGRMVEGEALVLIIRMKHESSRSTHRHKSRVHGEEKGIISVGREESEVYGCFASPLLRSFVTRGHRSVSLASGLECWHERKDENIFPDEFRRRSVRNRFTSTILPSAKMNNDKKCQQRSTRRQEMEGKNF